jgi:hypothetical protein
MSVFKIISPERREELFKLTNGLTPRACEYDEKLDKYVAMYFGRGKAKSGNYPSNYAIQDLAKIGRSNLDGVMMPKESTPVDESEIDPDNITTEAADGTKYLKPWVKPEEGPMFIEMCKFFALLKTYPAELQLFNDWYGPHLVKGLGLLPSTDDFLPRATLVRGKWVNKEWKWYDEKDATRFSRPAVIEKDLKVVRLEWMSQIGTNSGNGAFEAVIPSFIQDGFYDFRDKENPSKRDPALMGEFMSVVHPLQNVKDPVRESQPGFLSITTKRSVTALEMVSYSTQITDRQVIAIAGEKGTGKSVLARALEAAGHKVIDSDDWGRVVAYYFDERAKQPFQDAQLIWDLCLQQRPFAVSEFKQEALRALSSPIRSNGIGDLKEKDVTYLTPDYKRDTMMKFHYKRTLGDPICGFRQYSAWRIARARDEIGEDETKKIFLLTHTSLESSVILGSGHDACLLPAVNGTLAITSRRVQDDVGSRDRDAELLLRDFYKSMISTIRPISIAMVLRKMGLQSPFNAKRVSALESIDPALLARVLERGTSIPKTARNGVSARQIAEVNRQIKAMKRAMEMVDLVQEPFREQVMTNLTSGVTYLTSPSGASKFLAYRAGDVDEFIAAARPLGLTIHVDEANGWSWDDITPAMFATYVLVQASNWDMWSTKYDYYSLYSTLTAPKNRSVCFPDMPGRMHLKIFDKVFVKPETKKSS